MNGRMFFRLLLCLVVGVCASTASAVSGSVLTDSLPQYVRIVDNPDDAEAYRMSDSLFYEISGKTIFVVNRTELNMKDPFLQELQMNVIPLANKQGWTLRAMEVRGAASPEGPYNNNVRLSHGRAAALNNFLAERLDSVAVAPVTYTVAEDYPYLLWLLKRDGDGAANLLEKILIETNGDPVQTKARLQKSFGGRVWKRLLRDYYPKLRAAKVVLYFTVAQDRKLPELDYVPSIITDADLSQPYSLPDPICPIVERQHMLSVGTNILYDAFYMPKYGWAPMPNVQVEFYPKKGNWTFQAAFTSPYYHRWDKNKFFQIRDYHLEARRYFNPGMHHTGTYLAAYINAAKYGIGLSKTKGWQGEGMGAAVKVGYVLPLGNSRWRVDFHLAAGAFFTKYDPYIYGNPFTGEENGKYYYDYTGKKEDFKKRQYSRFWGGPTEIGITFTYDVLFWRIRKPGASFLRKEVICF